MINHQELIQRKIAPSLLIWGVIISFLAGSFAVLSSKYELGLSSIWPIIFLFFIFFKNYELGVICFVLSFAYQAPVVFAPSYGLSAVIRLDELIFAAIFPVWLMRMYSRVSLLNSTVPLKSPLLLYVVVAFLSLLVRYDAIGSTPFYNTATGFKGLGPLIYKLIEVVGGYFILTDLKLKERTQTNLFWCLPVVAAVPVVLSFFCTLGLLPINFIAITFYDSDYWYTRFALFGNTSSWGVLLASYYFILLYALMCSKSLKIKGMFFILLILCIYAVLISGTKTAIIMIALGSVILLISIRKYAKFAIMIVLITGAIIAVSIKGVDYTATFEQKMEIYQRIEKAYISTGIKGFDSLYFDTSLGSRIDHWFRFLKAVREEPELLVLGRGWHRRSVYPTGMSLHNDLLTATHDLGVGGAVFVVWIYFSMFKQFSNRKSKNMVLPKKAKLLQIIMQTLVIMLIASSFTGENLTLYAGGIDVQFPFIIMIMAVSWNYWKTTYRQAHYALLQKENIY